MFKFIVYEVNKQISTNQVPHPWFWHWGQSWNFLEIYWNLFENLKDIFDKFIVLSFTEGEKQIQTKPVFMLYINIFSIYINIFKIFHIILSLWEYFQNYWNFHHFIAIYDISKADTNKKIGQKMHPTDIYMCKYFEHF